MLASVSEAIGVVSPELALVDPQLVIRARAAFPVVVERRVHEARPARVAQAPQAPRSRQVRDGRPLAVTLAVTVARVLGIGRDAGSGVVAPTFPPPSQKPTAQTADPDLTPGVLAAFEARARRSPRSAHAREELGTAYLRLRRYRAAERELRALVRLTPKDGYAHCALGHALADQGRKQAAAREFAAAESLARG